MADEDREAFIDLRITPPVRVAVASSEAQAFENDEPDIRSERFVRLIPSA